MRWYLTAVMVISLVCAVRPEGSTEPSLTIMARSTVFNVGENRGIFCKAKNIAEPVEWYSPSNQLIEERSPKNDRIYVERKEEDDGILRPLIIAKIQMSDNGNWTCRAGNISETKEFIVGEKVVIPDNNISAEGEQGGSVKFTCEAKGQPTPVVMWYKDKTPIDALEQPKKYILRRNNSLEIKHLNHADVGVYFCKVTQKLLSHYTEKVVHLSVKHEPVLYNMETQSFYETPKNMYRTEEVYGILNNTKNITCAAIANPLPVYTWRLRHNSMDGDPITNPDMVITSEDRTSSVLVLRLYNESNIGEYKCTAENERGSVSVIFHVSLGAKPAPPDHVSLITANSSSLTFNVTCSTCNLNYGNDIFNEDPQNLTVIGYNFQLVPAKEGYLPDWDAAVDFPMDITLGNDTVFTVGPVSNSTKFNARVCSRNAAGYSDWVDISPDPATTDNAIRLTSTAFLFFQLLLCMLLY